METLSKQERLYKKKSIESLYAHGKSIKKQQVTLNPNLELQRNSKSNKNQKMETSVKSLSIKTVSP